MCFKMQQKEELLCEWFLLVGTFNLHLRWFVDPSDNAVESQFADAGQMQTSKVIVQSPETSLSHFFSIIDVLLSLIAIRLFGVVGAIQ